VNKLDLRHVARVAIRMDLDGLGKGFIRVNQTRVFLGTQLREQMAEDGGGRSRLQSRIDHGFYPRAETASGLQPPRMARCGSIRNPPAVR